MSQADFKKRWSSEAARVEKIISALKSGTEWVHLLGIFPAGGIIQALPFLDTIRSGFKDLRGLSLANVDLSGVNLEGMDLSDATFFKVTFDGAILSSNRSVSDFKGASFIHCSLKEARFVGANCENAHFGHSDLSNADFSESVLDGATLRSANFEGANLSGASLKNVNFVYSNLQGVCVSSETIVGITDADRSLSDRILLEDQALKMKFDRFQFATQDEALQGAAKVYKQLADAWEYCGFSESGNAWRSKERECLKLASEHIHG